MSLSLSRPLSSSFCFASSRFLLVALLVLGCCVSASPALATPHHTSRHTSHHTSKNLSHHSAAKAATPAVNAAASQSPIVLASSLDLLKQPQTYLNKTVSFEGEFRAFSGLGLDYKPAFKDSKDFVTLLLRRPDVSQRTIPLSELKMFYPRKKVEALNKLEPGAKVRCTGKVFSAALGDSWLELSSIEITQAAPKKPSKEEAAAKP